MQSVYCISLYKKLLHSEGSEVAPHRESELKWLGRSLYVSVGIMVVSLMSPSFFSYPLCLGMVFVTSFIAFIISLFVCFRRMITHRISLVLNVNINVYNKEVEEDTKEEEEITSSEDIDATALSDEITLHIEKHLTNWIDNRKYLQQNINIGSVAKEVYTNRTYLSRYINKVYGCSFRVWITQLRIDEAKRLLSEHPELSISDIATQIGASSQESFSHTFTNYTKVSPTKWREEHQKKII